MRRQLRDFGGAERCTLIGGGRTSPDRAAFYNSALVRHLDFNDSYPAPGETCHPSDNLGAVLAAAEYANGVGHDLLAALALAYQVQCRLSLPCLHHAFTPRRNPSELFSYGIRALFLWKPEWDFARVLTVGGGEARGSSAPHREMRQFQWM